MNEIIIPIPEADPQDLEDVATALETAMIFGRKGEPKEAIRWLRRAAQSASESGQDVRSAALARAAADLSDRFGSRPAPPPLPTPPPRQPTMLGVPPAHGETPAEALPLVTRSSELPKPDVHAKSAEATPYVNGNGARGTTPPPAPSSRIAAKPMLEVSAKASPSAFPPPPSASMKSVTPRRSEPPNGVARSVTPRPSSLPPAATNGHARSSVAPQAINGRSSVMPATKSSVPPGALASKAPARSSVLPSNGANGNGHATNGAVLRTLTPLPPVAREVSHEDEATTLMPAPTRTPAPPPVQETTPMKTAAAALGGHHHAIRVAVRPSKDDGVYEMRVLRMGELVTNGTQEGLLVLLVPNTDLRNNE